MIPTDEYKKVIGVLPIFCVDVIITDRIGRYLLVKRAYQPLKGRFWVVGGRVHKGESAEAAARRKTLQEVGLRVGKLRLVGYWEGFFDRNRYGTLGGIHTVSAVFHAEVEGTEPVRLDVQSTAWKYCDRLPRDFHLSEFAPLSAAPIAVKRRAPRRALANFP